MKRMSLIFLALGILALAVFVTSLILQNKSLPDSFTINIHGDYSSSGASRSLKSTLIFEEKELVSGEQTYEVNPTGGEDRYCEWTLNVALLEWAEQPSSVNCTDSTSQKVPLNFTSLEQEIKDGVLKPEDKCTHGDTCYKILE